MRLLIVVLGAAILNAQIPPTSREQALARALSNDIDARERIVDDAQVTDYITSIANKLVPFCAAGVVSVRVVQSEELNASVIPGGNLYVTTALLRFAETESELAGLLAHLMKRTPMMPNGNRAVILSGRNGDPFVLTADSLLPRATQTTASAATSQADERGMQCVDRAGYDPVGLITLLQRLPSVPVERMESLAETIVALEPSRAYLLNTSTFFDVRRHLAAIAPVQKVPKLRR